MTVLPPFHNFTTDTQMIEDTPPHYNARMQGHAKKTLGAVATAAKAAGVGCETVQVEREHPYQAIIDHSHVQPICAPVGVVGVALLVP
jgi:hypothetical protein